MPIGRWLRPLPGAACALLFLAGPGPAPGPPAEAPPSVPKVAVSEPSKTTEADGGGEEVLAVESLNAGLPAIPDPPDLETPQSSLANFIDSTARGDFDRAARSLNLNAYPAGLQPQVGDELARRLKVVMDQQVWFDWGSIPDRPDGKDDAARSLGKPDGATSPARSNILLYHLKAGDRDFEIRLQRVKAPRGPAAWVFSRRTVAQIPTLYREFAPPGFVASLPDFLTTRKFAKIALWQWAGFAVVLTAGALLGLAVQRILNFLLKRFESRWSGAVAEAIRGPGALTVGLWTVSYLIRTYLGLAGPILSGLEPIFLAVVVVGLVWFLQRLISILSGLISRRYESYNNDDANVLLTRITVARHLIVFFVGVGGALYVLTRFEWFQEIGTTLLASAGVAGLVLGIAAQRVLGNLFAGMILAITQPVKSGDAILFEGEFGWVEEISITYLVIRIWDLRRIVVPITYFMDHPVQNWSRRSKQMMLPVYVHADPRIDVGAVRAELKAILEESGDWDKAVPPILQVTASERDTIVLRALCSSNDPTSNWNLQCHVRERLVAFIRDLEGGRYLPRSRVALVDESRPPEEPPAPPDSANGKHTVPPPDGQAPPRSGQTISYP